LEYASISGRVADGTGAPLANAGVRVVHTATNVTASAVTDDTGRFRFPYLKVGTYEILVSHPGFRTAMRQLTLTVGAAFELPITLAIDSLETTLTVAAEAPVLEAARTQIAETVSEAEARTLPLNGRNFLDLALLVPGVVATNVSSTQLFPETSAVPGANLSITSQRNLSNSFIVDGLSANDDAAGLSGITYAVDALEQFQVVTSGAQAELGRALGGYVNVVTKSGTNVLRGAAYTYLRDDRFNASNALSGTSLPMDQAQYGGSAGGPVVRDRTFYFANAERRQLDQTGLTTIAPDDAAAVNARLNAVGYRGPLVTTGHYPNPVNSTNVLGKVDHQFGGRDQISVRYSRYGLDAQNARGAGGLNAASASSGLKNVDQVLAVGNTFTISPRAVLEARAQIARSDLHAAATDQIGPAVSIAGVASFGTSSGSPTRRLNTLSQLVNNLSYHAGPHALKGGVDVLYNDNEITYPRSVRGAYTFASLSNFLAGLYNNAGFAQTFGATTVAQTNPNVGLYLQDEWKASSRLTVNLGVRYDLQYLDTIHTDANNVSPRVGIVWSPCESRRTLIRGSVGLFYDRVPLRAIANALLSAGNTTEVGNLRQITVSLSPAQSGAPTFPNILPGIVPSVTLVNLTTMDRHLQNAFSRQASIEIEHQVGDHATVSVGYQYLRGLRLLMAVNQNVPTCVAVGNNNGCRPVAQYANNNQYSSAGESNYHGVHVSFTERPARWGHYRVSYTLSKSMNNVGEFFFSAPIDPFDLSKDWGRSDDDQRHRLVVNGSLQTSSTPATTVWGRLVNGFQVSGILQAYSGFPFNILSGVTTVQGTAGRPIVGGQFIARNAGEGNAFLSLNVRVSRSIPFGSRVRLNVLAEGFNVTNHRNVVTRNTTFGSGTYPTDPLPTFGRPTGVGESRAFQFGLRLGFQ
jgi:hypothetical protein